MIWLVYPRERAPGTHWTEGWLGPRAGIDMAKRNIPASAGNQTPVVQPT